MFRPLQCTFNFVGTLRVVVDHKRFNLAALGHYRLQIPVYRPFIHPPFSQFFVGWLALLPARRKLSVCLSVCLRVCLCVCLCVCLTVFLRAPPNRKGVVQRTFRTVKFLT